MDSAMKNRRLIGIARPRGKRGGQGRRDGRWGEGIGRSAGRRGIIEARVGRELRGGGCHFASCQLFLIDTGGMHLRDSKFRLKVQR